MAGLEKFGSPAKVQRLGNDSVYGSGSDGTVVIAANTSLTRDMYYTDLTINSGKHLNTNGFKVFVKGTLTLNGSIGMKSTDATVTSGTTLSGHTTANTAVTYSIGGATNTNGATQVPSSLLNILENTVNGTYIDSSSNVRVLVGGAGGPHGQDGTLDTNTAAPTTWTGKSGSAGGAGQYPPNAHSVGQPGGQGSSGSDGNQGSAGTSGSIGLKGTGGVGGPVVIVIAKNIAGSGTVYSQAKAGSAGTAATNGSAGSTGTSGASGTTAPGQGFTGYVNDVSHTRPTHHGGGDTHSAHMPHYHQPSHMPTTTHHTYNQHYTWHSGGNYFHHTHGDTHGTAGYTSNLNGVNHNHWNSHSPSGGHGNGAYAYLYNYSSHYGGAWHTYYWNAGKAKGYHGSNIHHGAYIGFHAGPALHSYTYSGTFPGGAGGAGGTGGPGGRAGTPTSGTDGYPGGGGGIIVLTETTPSVTLDTSGATSNSYTSSNGMQIVVLNQ